MERVTPIGSIEDTRSNSGLIRTKIDIPPLKSKLVERIRLLDRLSESRNVPLTVVSGVAASGKTSLACQWIERERPKVAWYSLDKGDNDIGLFSRYLLASLASADAGLASLISRGMQDGRAFTGYQMVSHLVQCLSDLPSEFYLVLDDYHSITGRAIHKTLLAFIDRMPSNMHVLILTRHDIPLSLSPLRVRNRVMEISASEMQFTEQEIELFFTDIIPVNLPPREIREVGKQMEGWVGVCSFLACR
jgi:LuxR family maltose regulon positive regulatory protein